MKKILTLLLFVTVLSCEDGEPATTCGVINPVEDLRWLKQIIKDVEGTYYEPFLYIQQAYYFGQRVFIINNCCPSCSSIVPVYNCDGELICTFGECADKAITGIKVIWKAENSGCTI